jgi:hypothetical protein
MKSYQSKFPVMVMMALSAFLAASAADAQNSPPLRIDVAELMQLSGAANIARELAPLISAQFVSSLRQSNPILPERTTAVVTEVVTGYLSDPARTKDLMDQLEQIYAQTFTATEVRQLIAFYKTPIGRKLTASLPEITSESAQIGQAWAAKMLPGLQEALMTRLRSEGLLPRS